MTQTVTIQEAVKLGAVDGVFYSHYFFPRTFRQTSPVFHRDIWAKLEDPAQRNVALSVFRDGAKTTLLRAFMSKMIAYGFAHTIMNIGKSEAAARRTNRWLMKQVEFNPFWASTFGLTRGKKWTEEEFEILHGVDQYPISVLAFGMTGSIRGVNLDDYRPDLIVVDDPCNTENTATREQLDKTLALLFADIQKTLAPRSEAPHAKMCLLQTPLAIGDAIDHCLNSPDWASAQYGVLDDKGESRWPARYPTDEVKREKESHFQAGPAMLGIWMREKECKVISTELSAFRVENLKYYDTYPVGGTCVMAIDPASSDSKEADNMAMTALYFYQSDVYVLDYKLFKGYDFDYLMAEFFSFIRLYRPRLITVESVAYQRTLMWHMKREMENRRTFVSITPFDDRRSKADRIIQALSGLSAMGHLLCRKTHTEFIRDFAMWGPKVRMKDDLLDSVAMGVTVANPALDGIVLEAEYRRIAAEEAGLEALEVAEAP